MTINYSIRQLHYHVNGCLFVCGHERPSDEDHCLQTNAPQYWSPSIAHAFPQHRSTQSWLRECERYSSFRWIFFLLQIFFVDVENQVIISTRSLFDWTSSVDKRCNDEADSSKSWLHSSIAHCGGPEFVSVKQSRCSFIHCFDSLDESWHSAENAPGWIESTPQAETEKCLELSRAVMIAR